MPGADFIPFPSNQVDENLGYKLAPIPKTKLLNRLPDARHSRYSCVTNLLDDGYDTWTVRGLLAYKDAKATMIYTHVLKRGGEGVCNPADSL